MNANANTSPQQVAANRANSQLSTGPVTPAGKDKIRFNALKHGVCAKAVVLPHEDKDAFTALGEFLRRIWTPGTELEEKHLLELQECEWRLDRIRKAESNLLMLGIHENFANFADEENPEVRRASSPKPPPGVPTPGSSPNSVVTKAPS